MIGHRIATLRRAPDQFSIGSTARFLLLLTLFFFGHVILEPHISFGAVTPHFYVMALVFSALRWGPLWGAVVGFMLGINQDAMTIEHFGLHGLAYTVAGFVLGRMKESLYLDVPVLDMVLLFSMALLTGLVVAGVGSFGSLALFEDRFFYEVPLSAVYTALLGGLLFRLVRD